jgi:hypothetical protein
VKRLYATESVDEAQRIQGLLKQAGIESTLDTKSGGSIVTGMVVFGVYVADKDAPDAAAILADWIEKHLDPEEPDFPMGDPGGPA